MLDLQVKDEQEAGYGHGRYRKPRRKLSKLERLRLAIVAHMREQRKAVVRWAKEQTNLPLSFPDWDHFKLGALKMSERMTPIISAVWEQSGTRFASRVGLDPDEWSVVNPHVADRIERASLAFCKETNATTSTDLQAAIDRLRAHLHEGIVNEGESIEQFTKRVQRVFETAEKSRARTIAQTETSRAVHAAQNDAAEKSGVVTGWRWQLSSDACPVCVAIAARNPVVRLGQPFAVIGKNPHYSHIFMPPAHPNCNCTAQEVLDIDNHHDYGNGPLIDPGHATEQELQTIRQQRHERDEAILRGSEAWGAAPYQERYPDGRKLPQKPPKPPVVKLPKVKPRQRYKPAPYEPAEIPGLVARPGEEMLPARMAWVKSFDETQHPRDEHGRFIGRFGHYAGKEPKAAAGVKEAIEKFHRGATLHDIAGLGGATDGADVHMESETDEEGRSVVGIHIKGDHYKAKRQIGVDANGKRFINNESFFVDEGHQGKGIGGASFNRMIEHAIAAGVSYVITFADRNDAQAVNGYAIWPKMGFDADIPSDKKRQIEMAVESGRVPKTEDGKVPSKLSELMKTPEGREWWEERGQGMEMRFDLTAGSISRKHWESRTSKTPTSQPKNWKLRIELGRRSLARMSG